jgi:hypothetical protein
MMAIELNVQYANTVIAFQDSGIVLKERSRLQLIDLALLAIRSGDKTLRKYFVELPSESELQTEKMKLLEV